MGDMKAFVLEATVNGIHHIGVLFCPDGPCRKKLRGLGIYFTTTEQVTIRGSAPSVPKLYLVPRSNAERTHIEVVELTTGKKERKQGDPTQLIPLVQGGAASRHLYSTDTKVMVKPKSDAAKLLAGPQPKPGRMRSH